MSKIFDGERTPPSIGGTVPVDQAAVARLRRKIDAGRYPIDPDAIAAAMVDGDLPPEPAQRRTD